MNHLLSVVRLLHRLSGRHISSFLKGKKKCFIKKAKLKNFIFSLVKQFNMKNEMWEAFNSVNKENKLLIIMDMQRRKTALWNELTKEEKKSLIQKVKIELKKLHGHGQVMALKLISSVKISGEIYLLIQFHELPVSLSLHDCLSTSDSLVGLDFLYFLKLIIYYTRYRDAVAEGALQITRSTETKFHSPTTQINFCLFVCLFCWCRYC